MISNKRFLGITVLTPYLQSEGIDAVLDNLVARAGATAVATNTSVTEPSAKSEGSLQPPTDAGASVRLFDRPLWGKRALWLRSGPGHEADISLFRSSAYQPRHPNHLTATEGPVIGAFIRAAKAAGLKVYIQTGATEPPGLRDEDRPRLPDASVPVKRLADTGSLASPAIRQYIRAWTQDLFATYPEVDGIRPDWPEYPCYTLGEAFQDFSHHVAAWGTQHDFAFDRIRESVESFYSYLHGSLRNQDLSQFVSTERGNHATWGQVNGFPDISDWFRLKAALCEDFLSEWRRAIDRSAGPGKELAANAFMMPFSKVTGMDFALASHQCDSILPKLYTMHWSLMVKFWSDELLAYNHDLDADLLVRTLAVLFDIVDDPDTVDRNTYGYPQPDEPHPIPDAPQTRKIEQVMDQVDGGAQVYAIVHGYGPPADFKRRLQVVVDSPVDGVWINRYGYLSDEKLDTIRAVWR